MTPVRGARKTAGKRKGAGPDKIGQILRFALEKGAWRAKAFPARKVVIDERVRLKCEIPLCPHFGTTLTCPPNVPSVDEMRKALRLYRTAVLVQTRAPLSLAMDDFKKDEVIKFLVTHSNVSTEKGGEPDEAGRNMEDVKLQAVKLHKLVNEVEMQAMSLGFHYALGLIGGDCMLCPKCSGPGTGCRRPYQARPSMEGVGIDCVKTAENAGLAFEIPPKEEVVWSGLILID